MKIKALVLCLSTVASLAAFGGEKIIKNGDMLVFAGDSITKFGNESEQGYVRLVVRGLAANGINVTYYGKGHSGWTASEIRGYFQNDVIDNHPQVCTIFAGVNDCGHGGWTKEGGGSTTPDDVAAMADMAIGAGIKPVLLSPTGVKGEDFKQNIYDYATAVKGIAQARNVPYAATYEAYRAYIDDPANPRFNDQYKAASDGTHMSPVGNRIIAREVLKAFGFDSTEMARAEAAWNEVPGITSLHPSVKITDGEYKAMKVAAEKAGKSLGAYHTDLFARGVELMKQNPGKVSATSGAVKQCSVSVPITYAQLDGMVDVGRVITDHDRIPAIANYALLAAVHELPAVTDAELPTEPVRTVVPGNFSKSIEFTVSGYTGSSTLADFPVAVRLSTGSPEDFAYSDMANSANGGELRFADGAGRSLAYEIECWNPQGESLVWVKLPALAKGTVFTMYYGGEPTDTVPSDWTWRASDYIGVWHMAEDGGTAFDSVNGLDAEPLGASASKMQKRTAGVFGQARVNSSKVDAHGGQSMLCVSDSTLLDFDGTFTFSGWVRMTELANDDLSRIVSRGLGSNYAPQWELRISGFDTLNAYSDSNTSVSGAIPSARNAWVHIAGVFNGSTFTAYANGAKVFEQTISPSPNSDYRLMFGAKDDSLVTGHFVGDYDEFRLRDAVSSADWVKAEYDQSKTTFLSSGGTTDGPRDDDPAVEEEDADEDWIRESAMTFGSTGAWTGDKVVVEAGRISVSNATFTAARPAPQPAVVTIATAFDFRDAVVKSFDTTKSAGIGVVKSGDVNRYAMLTAGGVVTNGTVVANITTAANVSVTLDDAAHTVSYAVDGVTLGTYPMAARQKGVSTVRYAGKTSVSALNGAYRSVKDPGGDTPHTGSGVQFFVD